MVSIRRHRQPLFILTTFVVAGLVAAAQGETQMSRDAESVAAATGRCPTGLVTAPGELKVEGNQTYCPPAVEPSLAYAHIADVPISKASTDACQETLATETTGEIVLDCKATLAVASGAMEPGDYTKEELEAAVTEAYGEGE